MLAFFFSCRDMDVIGPFLCLSDERGAVRAHQVAATSSFHCRSPQRRDSGQITQRARSQAMSRASARDGNEAHRVHVERSRRRDVGSHSARCSSSGRGVHSARGRYLSSRSRRDDAQQSAPLVQLIRTQCCAVGQACERWEKGARRWRQGTMGFGESRWISSELQGPLITRY